MYAVGGSATVARDLSHKLLKIGIKSSVYDDAHTMLMSAAILSDDDVIIAISHSGATRAVNDPVKLATRSGAKAIAITNYAESPIAKTRMWCSIQHHRDRICSGKMRHHALRNSISWTLCLSPLLKRI
jgi:DNA-binding MurR/RpiR family transcriptional regulator